MYYCGVTHASPSEWRGEVEGKVATISLYE